MSTAPTRFEHYDVLKREDGSLWELGRGAMGVTYKAFDTDLHCHVALKVINPDILGTEGTQQRFLREARAAAQLRHPNIATVLRLGKNSDETYYYAMEFCEGQTLQEVIEQKGGLDLATALNVTLQVAKALIVAEEHHLVHRDIKPTNLILSQRRDEELVVKLIDFGLAKGIGPEKSAWTSMSLHTAGFIGTAHFSSPEQLEEGQVDVRSDIYSLGATLWFMVTGKPVFSGPIARVISQHLSAPPPIGHLKDLKIPAPVTELLTDMLAKEPEHRPQTAMDLRRRLSDVMAELGRDRTEQLPPPLPDPPTPSPRQVGTIVNGRWRLAEELIRTRTGQSFRAIDLHDQGRSVTIKFLDDDHVSDPTAWHRLEADAKVLKEPPSSILRVIAVTRDEHNWPLIAFEWINGFPLVMLIRKRGLLTLKETLKILEPLASAVDYARENNLEGIDLQKEEILLGFPEQVDLTRDIGRLFELSVTEWQGLRVVVNALSPGVDHAASEATFFSTPTLLPGRPTSLGDVCASTEPALLKRLALLMYELLGGTPLGVNRATGLGGSATYIPLARLTAEGNATLRRAVGAGDGSETFVSALAFYHAMQSTAGYEAPWKAVEEPKAEPIAGYEQPRAIVGSFIRKNWKWAIASAACVAIALLGVVLLRDEGKEPTREPQAVVSPTITVAPAAVAITKPSIPVPTAPPSPVPNRTAALAFATAPNRPVETSTPEPTITATPFVDSEEAVRAFVLQYEGHERERDLDVIMEDYASKVSYNGASVDQAFIRKDKANYFERWPQSRESLIGQIKVERKVPNRWIARYRCTFRVQNAIGEWISGEVDNEVEAEYANERYYIVSQSGKVSRKQKGNDGGVVKGAFAGTWQGMIRCDVNDLGTKKVYNDAGTITIDLNESMITLKIGSDQTRYALVKKGPTVFWNGTVQGGSNSQMTLNVSGSMTLRADGKTVSFSQTMQKVALFFPAKLVYSGTLNKLIESGE